MKRLFLTLFAMAFLQLQMNAMDNKGISFNSLSSDRFSLIENGKPTKILVDEADNIGIQIALASLQKDFLAVSGSKADLQYNPSSNRMIIVGSLESKYIKQLIKSKKLDEKELKGKNEKYLMTVIKNPIDGIKEAL